MISAATDHTYQPALDRAAARHNRVLPRHQAIPWSNGAGVLLTCSCGALRGTLDEYRKHLIAVCVDSALVERS